MKHIHENEYNVDYGHAPIHVGDWINSQCKHAPYPGDYAGEGQCRFHQAVKGVVKRVYDDVDKQYVVAQTKYGESLFVVRDLDSPEKGRSSISVIFICNDEVEDNSFYKYVLNHGSHFHDCAK